MADVPVFCDSCGAIFFTRNLIGGSGTVRVSLKNVGVGPCPSCGGRGHVPDGVYEFVGDAVRWLTGPGTSYAQLRRLQDILHAVRSRERSIEDAGEEVERELPQFTAVFDWLRRRENRMEVATWAAILIAILAWLCPMSEDPAQPVAAPPTVNAERVLRNAAEQALRPVPSHKVGRNEPCYCGSGKKYKKCHGA